MVPATAPTLIAPVAAGAEVSLGLGPESTGIVPVCVMVPAPVPGPATKPAVKVPPLAALESVGVVPVPVVVKVAEAEVLVPAEGLEEGLENEEDLTEDETEVSLEEVDEIRVVDVVAAGVGVVEVVNSTSEKVEVELLAEASLDDKELAVELLEESDELSVELAGELDNDIDKGPSPTAGPGLVSSSDDSSSVPSFPAP